MKSADVIIIGGGVVGASVAYHLAVRGFKNIVVLERSHKPGEGSTVKATGGFRTQFSTEVNVRLSLLAREKLLRFQEELGIDPGYRQCGYLFIAQHERELDALHTAQEVQKKAGVMEASEVTTDDILRLNPVVNQAGILGGTFCSIDGFIDPINILNGYMKGSQRLGVRFEFNVECYGLSLIDKERIKSIRTSKGVYNCGKLVNAGGAWAGEVAKLAGIEVPVKPLKRQVAVTHPTNLLSEDMPMTIFTGDGFHLRVRNKRVLLLLPVDFTTTDPFETTFHGPWLTNVTKRAQECVPGMKTIKIDRAKCWAGLYEMTPDKHAIVGRAPGIENLYLVNGSSGHGVMHAPALGQLLGELILDGTAKTVDIQSLRPTRFAEGKPNISSDFL